MATVKQIPLILFLTVLLIVTLPFLLILFVLPLIIYRWILSKVYFCSNPDSVGLLNAQSALYCHLTPDGDETRRGNGWSMKSSEQCTVMLTTTVEGDSFDIHEFRALVSRELVNAKRGSTRSSLLHPEFQQFPVFWRGFLFWKRDTSFTIGNHVKLYENSQNWNDRDGEFCRNFVLEYQNENMAPNRSPWEITAVENVRHHPDQSPATMIVFKFPHFFADGYSIFNAVTHVADGGPKNVTRYEAKPPSTLSRALFGLFYPIKAPYDFVASRFLSRSSIPIEERRTRPKFDVDEEAAAGQPSSGMSLFMSIEIPAVEIIRQESKRLGVSFTTMVVVTLGRAWRKYWQKTPPYTNIAFVFPSPTHAKGLTNDFQLAIMNMPTNDADFKKQVAEFERELRAVKQSTLNTTVSLLWRLFGIMPTTWFWKFIIFEKMAITYESLLSVFPGPSSEFKILGRKVLATNFVILPGVLPLPPTMSILTYNGKIQVGLTAPVMKMSQESVGQLGKCIEKEFESRFTIK